MSPWLLDSVPSLLWVIFSCFTLYVVMIITTRLVGLRSFTAFSSFDFLVTLAMGALLASTVVSRNVALAEGITAIITLFLLQISVAAMRTRWRWLRRWVDTQPTLLMEHGNVLHHNLRAVRITESELLAKLRAHNVSNYQQVKAVVLESSGDVSVIHEVSITSVPLDDSLLKGVIRDVE